MVYGIRQIAWQCNVGTLHGSQSLHFPNTHNQKRQRWRARDWERKTSIKADSVHNLKRRSSSEEMLRLCGLFVLGKWTMPMPMPRWIGWHGWLGHGLAWHTETHITGEQCKKAKEKEVNCRLLSENESVCRKATLERPSSHQRHPNKKRSTGFPAPTTIRATQPANNPNNSSFSQSKRGNSPNTVDHFVVPQRFFYLTDPFDTFKLRIPAGKKKTKKKIRKKTCETRETRTKVGRNMGKPNVMFACLWKAGSY